MLTELHIENLGVIERASLVLGGGVTALTGETGAGKTMLVEAIELLVGGRSDATVVRTGAAEARIDGRLVLNRPDGIEEIVLTRIVPADGRSRAYVNGRPTTVANLAELTDGIIDLHGQHAHQGLLSTATQRAALDQFGAVDLSPLRAARARLTEVEAELATLGGDERARAREIDLLRFQVGELDAAGVTDPDEDAHLDRDEAILADAVAHHEAGLAALGLLRDDDGVDDRLRLALHALGHREPYIRVQERLTGLLAELDDIGVDLRDRAEAIEEDPDRLDEIRQRRQLLRDLQRKYGDGLSEVIGFHSEAEDRLRDLERYDLRAGELDQARKSALEAERLAANQIGLRRRAVAPELAKAVERRLRDLAMPNAAIAVEVGRNNDDQPGDLDIAGDAVRFMLSANPGSALLPLNRVASGGELARTMLALRLVLSGVVPSGAARAGGDGAGGGAPTLVFDEVDAGIGGTAATAVGQALADLGADHQVLVVTHLPQVAASASRQLVVSKSVSGGATFTSVDAVVGNARVAEVARMMSGSESPAALDHARDLLQSRAGS
jgi:DNA repair protein RecN (Recombination protein N)